MKTTQKTIPCDRTKPCGVNNATNTVKRRPKEEPETNNFWCNYCEILKQMFYEECINKKRMWVVPHESKREQIKYVGGIGSLHNNNSPPGVPFTDEDSLRLGQG